ncbi:MAG: GCAxxG family protein [Herbinix sp.]|jgi:C_GCAxxG_C_C family probable redox protein|nr:GCAxxG family protein [Herbinix sp.]
MNRIEVAEKLFQEGYNCSQAVFSAYSDLYNIDLEVALKLSAGFGGGVGRLREVCGAVSGMTMIAGLETGTDQKMDVEGKKYNYEVVQKLAGEFKNISGSIICKELLNLGTTLTTDPTPQKRDKEYYTKRPCIQLVRDAAEIIEKVLYAVSFEPVNEEEQIKQVAGLAEEIWHEHYEAIIGKEQVDYMIEHFQSENAITEQIHHSDYEYFLIKSLGGYNGYLSYRKEEDAMFLSKIYLAKRFRGRGNARKAIEMLEQICGQENLNKIWLTVNRNNENSIHTYEGLGFKIKGTQVADIGGGFVMDDYIMEKTVDVVRK